MDTSKEYIRMCQEAKEVQQFFLDGRNCYAYKINVDREDEICYGDNDRSNNVATFWGLFGDDVQATGNIGEDIVWLPRQDQLQEMCFSSSDLNVYFVIDDVDFGGFIKFVEKDIATRKELLFKTMEQYWLAFIMGQRYQKKWAGDKWTPQNQS